MWVTRLNLSFKLKKVLAISESFCSSNVTEVIESAFKKTTLKVTFVAVVCNIMWFRRKIKKKKKSTVVNITLTYFLPQYAICIYKSIQINKYIGII